MLWHSSRSARLFVLTCMIGLMGVAEPARACSMVSFKGDGRYVGGDLVTQIAAKADTIQIMRVTRKEILSRSYPLGAWYLNHGDLELPENYPEFIDEFVFGLEVVETLKIEGDPTNWIYEQEPRVVGYDPTIMGWRYSDVPNEDFSHPNRLPAWLLERPGNGGFAFIGAEQGAGLGGGECSSPYVLEVGQQFVALRNSIGRLYPGTGAFPLEIDTEFRTEVGGTQRLSLNMQSLIPISGPDDPFLTGLRQAVARQRP